MRQKKNEPNETSYSILTLDDDPIITSTIQAYFTRSGYRVDTENDPNRAIERVREGNYDILLLDFLMSPICGDQVVEQIRQFNTDLFIILLTGHKSMAPPIKTIRALDIQGYYEKSDRFDQLELLVESCVKSIQQMRTIQSYKAGLSTIVDSLPQIYNLSSLEHITDNILKTAVSMLPCLNVTLTLDKSYCHSSHAHQNKSNFVFQSIGTNCPAFSDNDILRIFRTFDPNHPHVQGNEVILPLSNSDQTPLGLFTATLKDIPTYEHLQLIEVFARQASSAICNAQLHTLLQEKNAQLETSYLETISTMRRVVEAKDPYTRGHSDRVSSYAFLIAQRMGKDAEYCERVRIAGLFHDVGKLFVPNEILLKPERLSDSEYQAIKAHPVNGVELLAVITHFRPILQAVRSHHERMDGRGYPDGLMGTDIPEEARIIAVADTFDAMTSNRQYRKAMAFQYAADELERCKGTQLDAEIVDVFLALMADCSPDELVSDIDL